MKCKNCKFDNIGVEFISIEELDRIEKDEEETLKCEYCGNDLIPQLKKLGGNKNEKINK